LKTSPPPPPAEPTARAPDLDPQAFVRALQRVWPQTVVMEEWERIREEGFVRRAMARAIAQASRSCPGCGAPHSLAEVCR
jgi:hypothetical protein